MATGDWKWFAQAIHDLGEKAHDLSSDDLRMGLVTAAVTPAVSTASPHWGGTGTTDMSGSQVSTGGTSYTGPVVLASVTWTLGATGGAFDFSDVSFAQDASGFTDARWGIVYNNTDANKRCIGYLDLGSDRSIVAGTLTLVMNTSGVLAIAQS